MKTSSFFALLLPRGCLLPFLGGTPESPEALAGFQWTEVMSFIIFS